MNLTSPQKLITVDASVAIKWYFNEVSSQDALRWYRLIKNRSVVAIAPELIFLEISNVVLRRYKFSGGDCLAMVDDLERLGLEVVPVSDLNLTNIIRFAAQHRLTVYDASYLEVARVSGTRLLTVDQEMIERVPALTQKLA